MTATTTDPDLRCAELAALLGGFAPVSWRIAGRQEHTCAARGHRCEQLRLEGEDGRTTRAFLTGPAGPRENLPAAVYCHAHGNRYDIGASELTEGRPALLDPPYAQALAEAGIIALCIDLPCFGDRSCQTESSAAKRHLWRGTTLFGEMLSELAGLPDLLMAEGADPGRIGALGISMGATLAFWLAALDPRIRAVAHLCCFADLETLVESGAHDLHGVYMTVPGLLPRFTTGGIAGLAAPRPQLVCIGADDPLTPPAAVARGVADLRAAYEASGAGDSIEVLLEPGVGHQESAAMRRRVLGFLGSHL